MGDGPYYTFYVPYHLPHLEAPLTVARAVLFGDAAIAPAGAPAADVLTAAKIDLDAGRVLDGIGGFHCYGMVDNASVAQEGNYLPMSLAEGCKLRADVKRDDIISYLDVELPEGRLCDRLRNEQNAHFGVAVLREAAT
jgi:predicted homoserine dehydrogenase-like protein